MTPHKRPLRLICLALIAITILGLSACSSDSKESSDSKSSEQASDQGSTKAEAEKTSTDEAFPVTIAGATITAKPEKIVSLSATATEVLFAIGAGDQVVAVDSTSNFPAEAPVTDLSAFEPNVEAILSYQPDLVIASYDPGELVAGLDKAGVPVILQSAATDLDDAYSQIEQLGAATAHVGDAAEVVANMQSDIDELMAKVDPAKKGLSYFHEVDDTLYTVTSKTFIGQLYAMAGLTNVADSADPDGALGGYPQFSAESLIAANPDLIFLSDTKCCAQSAATVAARPGWDQLKAVTLNDVIPLDDDIASRWGPRVVDLFSTIVDAVNKVPVAAG